MKALFLLVVLGMVSSRAAHAQQRTEQRFVFPDEAVDGGRQSANGDVIQSRRPGRHRSLIRVRENFHPELEECIRDI